MAQETQTVALYQPREVGWGGRWEGGSKGRGYMYTYGWFMLRFDRKQQNSVKLLSFNKTNYFFKWVIYVIYLTYLAQNFKKANRFESIFSFSMEGKSACPTIASALGMRRHVDRAKQSCVEQTQHCR